MTIEEHLRAARQTLIDEVGEPPTLDDEWDTLHGVIAEIDAAWVALLETRIAEPRHDLISLAILFAITLFVFAWLWIIITAHPPLEKSNESISPKDETSGQTSFDPVNLHRLLPDQDAAAHPSGDVGQGP